MAIKDTSEIQAKPYFSVVMPVYNKEPHIARSIESVLDQTFTDFELIIVCDPSTDNSNYEVEKFLDPRIRVFYRNEPGPGGYAARNLGVLKSKAEWIAFLDADDEWFIDYLFTVHQSISKLNRPCFVGSGWKTFDPTSGNEPQINAYHKENKNKGLHTIDFKEYLYYDFNIKRPFNTSTAVIKRDILIKSGLFPAGKAHRGGDVDTWLRCAFICEGLAINNYIGACYHRDSVNMVTKHSIDDASSIRSSIKEILNLTDDSETRYLLKKLSNYYTRGAWSKNFYSKNYIKNFNLSKALYYEIDTKTSVILGIISLLPDEIILKIRDINKSIKEL